jgi:hypothetical protein
VVYVENAGDFRCRSMPSRPHSQKVIVDCAIDKRLRQAIRHAHDAEDPRI